MATFLTVLAVIFLWCVFWWVAGPLYFRMRVNHPSLWPLYSRYAPIMPFLFPYAIISDMLEGFALDARAYQFQRVAQKIAEELERRGIKVESYGYNFFDGCEVVAEIRPDQVEEYQAAYAWAIRKFSRYAPGKLCSAAKPLAPLDETWAKSLGLHEYAAENFTAPCRRCGKKNAWDVRWGDAVSHQKEYGNDTTNDFSFVRKDKLVIKGYICEDCRKLIAAGN